MCQMDGEWYAEMNRKLVADYGSDSGRMSWLRFLRLTIENNCNLPVQIWSGVDLLRYTRCATDLVSAEVVPRGGFESVIGVVMCYRPFYAGFLRGLFISLSGWLLQNVK